MNMNKLNLSHLSTCMPTFYAQRCTNMKMYVRNAKSLDVATCWSVMCLNMVSFLFCKMEYAGLFRAVCSSQRASSDETLIQNSATGTEKKPYYLQIGFDY